MSAEEAWRLIERVKTDEAFREKILAEEDVAGRLRLAEAEGCDVNEEDIGSMPVVLGDADLDRVAGGCWDDGTHSECSCDPLGGCPLM